MFLPSRSDSNFLLLGVIIAGIATVSCTTREVPSVETSSELLAVELGDTQPLHKMGNIYLGGQPAEEDLETLKDLGFTTIINLRNSSETDWDESAVAERLGMRYVYLPFQKPEELTDELFNEALATLSQSKDAKTLLHCGSCNRVGAIWYAHRVLQDSVEPEQAEQEARDAGMRSEWLLDAAQEYVERRTPIDDGL